MSRTSWIVGAAAALGLVAVGLISRTSPFGVPSPEDRAIAMGLMLHTPVSEETLDLSIRIADRLRHLYGLESGNIHADRVAAAQRAHTTILEELTPTPEELRVTAEALGYSLDPATCGNTCTNVARLARLEIEKLTLQRVAMNGVPAPN